MTVYVGGGGTVLCSSRDFQAGCLAQRVLIAILHRLDFYISFPKVTSPATNPRFLGIDINTNTLELTLPEGKLTKMTEVLVALKGKRTTMRLQPEWLAGLLAYWVGEGGPWGPHLLQKDI